MKMRSYSIDLSAQMAVCDANYIRILKLLGDLRAATKREILLPSVGVGSLVETELLVCIEVVEQFKYTSTLKVSQKQMGAKKTSDHYDMPEMLVRVYHDASTAEVISYQNHRNFKMMFPVPNKQMYHADEKEQLNLFLAEWLELCQQQGLLPAVTLSKEYMACFANNAV